MRIRLFLVCTLLLCSFSASPGFADKRDSDLAKCQQTIEKETIKQKQKETSSYAKCLGAVRKDLLEKGMVEVSEKTASSCQ